MFWKFVAWLVTREIIFKFIVWWAQYFPYFDIYHDGKLYMRRWWVIPRLWNLPAIRLHHIVLPDTGRHLHSHPFNFRTIILRGGYSEEVPISPWPEELRATVLRYRHKGDTTICGYGQFHRIRLVTYGGVWTLFITWGGKRNDWGFMTEEGYVQADVYHLKGAAK